MDAQTFADHVNVCRLPPREVCMFVVMGAHVRANRPSQPLVLPSGLVQFDCINIAVDGVAQANTRVTVDPDHVSMLIL